MKNGSEKKTKSITFYSLHVPIIILAALLLGAGIILFDKITSDEELISTENIEQISITE